MHANASNTLANSASASWPKPPERRSIGCAISGRALPARLDVPDPLEHWRMEAHDQERRQRAETRRRRQKEADDMRKSTPAASAPDNIDQRIAVAIESALKIERKNNRAVMAEVLAQMQAIIDKRLDAAIGVADNAIRATDKLASRMTALADGGPDGSGVIRKQVITPH
jgi:hypothetical protein